MNLAQLSHRRVFAGTKSGIPVEVREPTQFELKARAAVIRRQGIRAALSITVRGSS